MLQIRSPVSARATRKNAPTFAAVLIVPPRCPVTPLSNSSVSGPVARPSTNCRTAGSSLFMNSSGVASKRMCPPTEQREPSPIFRALGMWCVIVTIVARNCWRIPRITSAMTSVMIGSRPVFGSSNSRISGSWAIARAKPDPAPHAARELRRPLRADVRQLHELEALLDARSDLRRRLARPPEGKRDVVVDAHRVEERALLEGHAELLRGR